MKVTTLNVNGLRSAERRGFRKWLARSKPDVLCLQEVRADESCVEPALWKPRGWRVAWHPAQKKGYAGTAVWARDKGARFTVGCGHPRGQEEGRLVGAHLEGIDVWSLYMPSGSSGPERQAWKYEYMEHVYPWLARVIASGRPTLVCGDVNIAHTPKDIRNARSNEKNSGFLPDERAWLDKLVAMGWRDLFREANPTLEAYSWWSNRGQAREHDVGWRIDHIWATPGVVVEKVVIEREADLSDHAPVSAWVRVASSR
ncbi:MAG: exodeoxyribonuclease III [Myxococcota bacterium]